MIYIFDGFMAETKEKEQLTDLIKGSQTLSAEKKTLLLDQLNTLSDENVKKLTIVFVAEKGQLKQIDEKYLPQEAELKKNYLDTLQTFEHSGIQEALKRYEAADDSNKEQELQNILSKIPPDSPPKKKTKGHFLMIFAVVIILGVIVYLVVHK